MGEIVECVVDKIMGKNTQYGVDNTMMDLIHNFVGSLPATGLGWLYVRLTHPDDRRRLAEPLGKLVGAVMAGDVPERASEHPESDSSVSVAPK